MTIQASRDEIAGGYRHEAFLYSGMPEFLSGTTSFIRRAVNARDPVLVVVSSEKVGLLRQRLGDESEHVDFADMAEVGGNPARIIAVWQDFVTGHPGSAQLWGVGEPIHPDRSPAGLAECQLHEALLNVAFDAATRLWLLCPYDLEALADEVINDAQRSHPFVAQGVERRACSTYRPIDLADPFNRPVPPRPAADAPGLSFELGSLREVRAFVAEQAALAGLTAESADAMCLALSEIATNSIRHGGGRGEIRAWTDERSLVCEVSDRGHITSPLVGRQRPAPDAGQGAGLWVANQLCDLVQVYSSANGTTIRVHCCR
ncbi:MAG TPA: sensor histidine kinase [Streptosporangiaceae bacterium]|nr:sensor histidine kinase [Streptosporangiaceae bacterium]